MFEFPFFKNGRNNSLVLVPVVQELAFLKVVKYIPKFAVSKYA